MAAPDSARPLSLVLTQVVSQLGYLLQTEIRLARSEIGEQLVPQRTLGQIRADFSIAKEHVI